MPDIEYGLTPQGPNIKRLDVILDELHTELSEKWGVNTRQNPESLVNVLLTDFADKLAELWEYGSEIYFAMYPAFAEGTSLDNAAQYGGSTRETAARSYYPIHCTGIDGTNLVIGTKIASDTNPVNYLSIKAQKQISRSSFNKAQIKIAGYSHNSVYSLALNGMVYSYSPAVQDEVTILQGMAETITDTNFYITVDEEHKLLVLEAKDITSSNVLVLSENLTTETVTSIITFGTDELGNIMIPERAITKITKADPGLKSVVNLCGYIAGRQQQSDIEFRQSYADKIFNRSSMMLESIKSSILKNVQGVISVAPYENPSHNWDDYGRPPHSIEIVVDGGDSQEIAQEILAKKAGGINTYGDTTVIVKGEYDEDIPIHFSRPTRIYTWFSIGIVLSTAEAIPPNYVEILRDVITEKIGNLDAGDDVIPQKFMTELHRACSGISYMDIKLFATDDSNARPESYTERSIEITARQRAYTYKDMIEVHIDG